MPAFPDVFYAPSGFSYVFGVAAAGVIQYFPADVALTGSPVRQFQLNADINVQYDFEAQLYLNVSGAGTVTTVVGITTGTATVRQVQIAQVTATTSETRAAAGTGNQTLTSSSLATGTAVSVIVRGSARSTAGGGVLFLDMSGAGTATLLTGSTFRVFRSE